MAQLMSSVNFAPMRSSCRSQGTARGCALRAGFAAACGDLRMMDADGSWTLATSPPLRGRTQAGADVAKGSRFVQGVAAAT
jgi:hypothetical protein